MYTCASQSKRLLIDIFYTVVYGKPDGIGNARNTFYTGYFFRAGNESFRRITSNCTSVTQSILAPPRRTRLALSIEIYRKSYWKTSSTMARRTNTRWPSALCLACVCSARRLSWGSSVKTPKEFPIEDHRVPKNEADTMEDTKGESQLSGCNRCSIGHTSQANSTRALCA